MGNNVLIDRDQYNKNKNFKNMNDIERDRSQLSHIPSAEDLIYSQNKIIREKKEEEGRINRLNNNDNQHFLQYNKLNKRLLPLKVNGT